MFSIRMVNSSPPRRAAASLLLRQPLTLLAMVLAIGLVVDDAIVVVENIQRHIEQGQTPTEAALDGAREIAFPVIAMTLTLAAVYAPIGLIGGLSGALFSEFAFALAGAVVEDVGRRARAAGKLMREDFMVFAWAKEVIHAGLRATIGAA